MISFASGQGALTFREWRAAKGRSETQAYDFKTYEAVGSDEFIHFGAFLNGQLLYELLSGFQNIGNRDL